MSNCSSCSSNCSKNPNSQDNVAALAWFKKNTTREMDEKGHYTGFKMSSEYQDCATPFSLDTANLCFYSCSYCFAYFQKASNPSFKEDTKVRFTNVKSVIDLFEGKHPENRFYKYFIKNKKILHIGGMADPFCGFEKKYKRGMELIEYLLKSGYPVIMSTKGNFLEYDGYREMFNKYKDVANCAIQASIITPNAVDAAKIEVGVPSPEARLQNLKELSAMGYYTILRLRPFIIGVSDKYLGELLERMNDCNIHSLSTEFYCMDLRVNEESKTNYKHMSSVCGFDIETYYRELSPTNRGSYLRLNRKVKEKFIKTMYKFCVDNDKHFACSDPDFKELNMSGCCCGLPNDEKKWGLLTNFFHGQLTNMIRKLRVRYNKSGGEDKYLKLSDIENHEGNEWLQDTKFWVDSVCGVGMPTSIVKQMNYFLELKKVWNNTRSAKCPYNYFQGKIKPSGKLDEDNNIIYEYVPSTYEKKWRDEGLL